MKTIPLPAIIKFYHLIDEKYDDKTKSATITQSEILERITGCEPVWLNNTAVLFDSLGINIARSESLIDKNDVKFTFWGPTRDDFVVGTKVSIMRCYEVGGIIPAGTEGTVVETSKESKPLPKHLVTVNVKSIWVSNWVLIPANNLRKM